MDEIMFTKVIFSLPFMRSKFRINVVKFDQQAKESGPLKSIMK